MYADGYVQAVKSTFPTVHQVHEVRAATDDGFRVFYGSFMAPLEGMAGGAHGWISGILNVATADAVVLWNAMQASDLDAARAAWARILPIKELYTKQPLGPASDLAIYRAMLRQRGQVAGFCRAAARSHARPGRASAGAPRADRRRRCRLTSMAGVSLLVHGGEVVDGTGNPGYRAAIAVADGRVRVLRGDVGAVEAERRIDASGKVVAPGFIDAHSHSALVVLDEPMLAGKVLQGVTTEVVGIDGLSYTPFPDPDDLHAFVAINSGIDGDPDVDYDWRDLPGYFARVDGRTSRRTSPRSRATRRCGSPRWGGATRPRPENRPPTRLACSRRSWRPAHSASRRASTTRPGPMPPPTS